MPTRYLKYNSVLLYSITPSVHAIIKIIKSIPFTLQHGKKIEWFSPNLLHLILKNLATDSKILNFFPFMLYNSNKKCIKTLEKKKNKSPNIRMHSIYIYIYRQSLIIQPLLVLQWNQNLQQILKSSRFPLFSY